MQVTRGTWRMHNSVYQALFSPPLHESLGTRLDQEVHSEFWQTIIQSKNLMVGSNGIILLLPWPQYLVSFVSIPTLHPVLES